MTLLQIAVSFLGLVIGYLLVSWLVDRLTGNAQRAPIPVPPGPLPAVTLSNWFKVLGVAEHATKDDIMRAYEAKNAQNMERRVKANEPGARAECDAEADRLRAAYAIGMRLYGQT